MRSTGGGHTGGRRGAWIAGESAERQGEGSERQGMNGVSVPCGGIRKGSLLQNNSGPEVIARQVLRVRIYRDKKRKIS